MNGQNRVFYLIKRMFIRFFEDGISQAAAELSYFLLFSLAPLLMFLNTVLAHLHISIDNIQPVLQMLPSSLSRLVESYLNYIAGEPSVSPMLIGIGLTLYFLSRAVRSMMRTVNNIYHIEIKRDPVVNTVLSFGITAGFLVSIVCSFVLVVAGKTLLRLLPQYFPIPEAVLNLTHSASFWVMIAFIFVFLMLFNRVVPNLYLRFRDVWPGALFSLVAWILVSWGFSFYVDNMARYSVLYGSLGAVIVLMLWLYIVSMILLMGPQLNHTLVVMKLYRVETGKQK